MSVVLNEVLTLVGRLDDAPGADTPRERFRRFLLELTDLEAARALIEQAQRSLGEQQHRALQDAIVRLGRFLGFETAFGIYHRGPGAATCDGRWRSRHRLEILLDVRTNQTSTGSVDELVRSLAALTAIRQHDADVQHIGLCIITPMYGSRARLEDAVRAVGTPSALRVVSVRSLLWLADMVNAERLTHDEVVRLLASDGNLDFLVDLLARFAEGPEGDGEARADARALSVPPSPVRSGPAHWVAAIGSDETATPEQFVESVIRGRGVLGIGEAEADLPARANDWICFSLGAKGIVGHARVESIADGTGLLRGSHRFRSVFRLKDIEIYDTPVAIGRDGLRARLAALTPVEDAGPFLASVSGEEFAELTVDRPDHGTEDLHRAG